MVRGRQADADLPTTTTRRSSRSTILFSLLLLAIAAISYSPRIAQYLELNGNRELHFAGAVPAASADSYYWYRSARLIYEGTWRSGERDRLRRFPDGVVRGDPPWLARIVATLAHATDGDVYAAGQIIALVTSCLFIFPLGFFAARVGWPAAGLVGAGLGATSAAVSSRTMIYQLDRDSLTLFGLWTICLAFAFLDPATGRWRQVATTVVAAVATALFVAWNDKPVFYLVFCLTFPVCLAARKLPWRRAVLLSAVFALLANPLNLARSLSHLESVIERYVLPISNPYYEPSPEFSLANVEDEERADSADPTTMSVDGLISSISEARQLPIRESLSFILDPGWVAALGILSFLAWSLWHWRIAAPLAPLAALGAMGLFSANRFLMFLAPLAGLGIGFLFSAGVHFIARRTRFAPRAKTIASLLALPMLGFLLPLTNFSHVSEAPVSVELIRSLGHAAKQIPIGAPVWYQWGSSYLLQDVMGAATYQDSLPDPEIGHLYLNALTGDDPRLLVHTIAFLQSHSKSEVRKTFREDYDGINQAILAESPEFTRDTYLLLTDNSMKSFVAHYRRGQWRPETGWPPDEYVSYFRCIALSPTKLNCLGNRSKTRSFDLTRGALDGKPVFGRIVTSLNGFKSGDRILRPSQNAVVEVVHVPRQQARYALVMRRPAYRSVLNKLYILAEYDDKDFELVYDDFPIARLYRIKSASEAKPDDS